MPANLTPMYHKAEREFRRAQSAAEQLECLQKMLQLVPKHKGTDHLQARIKSQLREARRELQQQLDAPRSSRTFRIPRQGAGRIVIIGAPNAGKSRLLNALTGATSEVAEFPFTTREPVPAMMMFRGVQVQVIDTPPVCEGQVEPWMLNLVRTADAVLLAFDGSSDDAPEETWTVFQEFSQRKTVLSSRTGFDTESFATLNVSSQLVATRADNKGCGDRLDLFCSATEIDFPVLSVECDQTDAVSGLKESVYGLLNVIRVFTKPPGKEPDLKSPLTVAPDGTVEDLALQVHADLFARLKHARLWRDGDHDGQIVGREYRLRDGDLIELH